MNQMLSATQKLQSAPAFRTVQHSEKERLIFLVDDDLRTLGAVEAVLGEAGFEVRAFQSAREALDAFARLLAQPRLLITDYGMGDMNGFELIQRCRAIAPGLRVIMLSGTLDHDAARQFPFRVELFLSKPVRPAQLLEAVHQFLPPAK